MLLGYSQPSGITWTVGGTGAAFLGDGTADRLNDGIPARAARVQWLSSGSPAIGQYVTLTASWAAATALRVLTMRGLTLPAGCKVEVRGQVYEEAFPETTLGGNALTQRTVLMPSGEVCLVLVFDVAGPGVVALEIRIYNDVACDTWATAATTFDIGEIALMPAVDLDIQSDWSAPRVKPTVVNRSLNGQASVNRRASYRRLSASLTPEGVSKVRAGGLANNMDWEKLEAALEAGPCIAIPRWGSAASLDTAEMHRTCVYGLGSLSGSQHLGGNYYGGALAVDEIPA